MARGRKDTANRPSQANQEFVRTKDGRRVRNLAYNPLRKRTGEEREIVPAAAGAGENQQPREFVVYFNAEASAVISVEADSIEEAKEKVWFEDLPEVGYGSRFEPSGDWDYLEDGIEDCGDGTYSVPMTRSMQSNFSVEATSYKEAETAAFEEFAYPGPDAMDRFDLGDWDIGGIRDEGSGEEILMEDGYVIGDIDHREVSQLREDEVVVFKPRGYSAFFGAKFTPSPDLKTRAGTLSITGDKTENAKHIEQAGRRGALSVFGHEGDEDGSLVEYGIADKEKASAIVADEFVRLGGDPSLARKIKVSTRSYGNIPVVGADMDVPASVRDLSLAEFGQQQASIFGLAVHNMTRGDGEIFRRMADPDYGKKDG